MHAMNSRIILNAWSLPFNCGRLLVLENAIHPRAHLAPKFALQLLEVAAMSGFRRNL